ncbi:MAG: serine O-acetyltransferase [Immundisolibacterales bacterium]|nr:serine O-acetyltransferase [Immundisolibacterales bacterium]
MSKGLKAVADAVAWPDPEADLPPNDPTGAVWRQVRREAQRELEREPALEEFLDSTILSRQGLEDSLAWVLSHELASPMVSQARLQEIFDEAHARDPAIGDAGRADLQAVRDRDPALETYFPALLFFKGYHALQAYRIAHRLWNDGRELAALLVQSRMAQVYGVDIHPAARIGTGIMIDHATGVVVGETAVIEDDVSILHEVTLGGTGKETGDRHPKVRAGVLIGAGAKLLGNVEIGAGAKIGAGSVVLSDVPSHRTVVGVPAEVVGTPESDSPALTMDHRLI